MTRTYSDYGRLHRQPLPLAHEDGTATLPQHASARHDTGLTKHASLQSQYKETPGQLDDLPSNSWQLEPQNPYRSSRLQELVHGSRPYTTERSNYYVANPSQSSGMVYPEDRLGSYSSQRAGLAQDCPPPRTATQHATIQQAHATQSIPPDYLGQSTSDRRTPDAQRQGFASYQSPRGAHPPDVSPLQPAQRQETLRGVADLTSQAGDEEIRRGQRSKKSRRTNAKRPEPITGDVHDGEYMGFASDDDFYRYTNLPATELLGPVQIVPQLVLMYPRPDWDPQPDIDFRMGGKFGVNLEEAHKAYLRDSTAVALEPLKQSVQITDSKARGRLPVMIYIRVCIFHLCLIICTID